MGLENARPLSKLSFKSRHLFCKEFSNLYASPNTEHTHFTELLGCGAFFLFFGFVLGSPPPCIKVITFLEDSTSVKQRVTFSYVSKWLENMVQTEFSLAGAFDIRKHLKRADFYLERDLEKFVGPQSQEPRSRDLG